MVSNQAVVSPVFGPLGLTDPVSVADVDVMFVTETDPVGAAAKTKLALILKVPTNKAKTSIEFFIIFFI
jgi:hypothetical protein